MMQPRKMAFSSKTVRLNFIKFMQKRGSHISEVRFSFLVREMLWSGEDQGVESGEGMDCFTLKLLTHLFSQLDLLLQ